MTTMERIEWVRAIATNGQVSEAKFGPHLNIIVGPSNCGKTMVLKCIDYLLGASKPPFKKGDFGIESVQMKIVTKDGYAILSRRIGATKATIESHTGLVKNGEYNTGTTGDPFNYGQMLMGLFGVPLADRPAKIFKTADAQTVPLSIRQIVNTFIVKENPIISPENILVPSGTPITAVKAAILYQLYGENFITGNEKDPDWVKNKKSIKKFITDKINDLTKNNDWLEMAIFDAVEDTIRQQADNIIKNLDDEYFKIQEHYSEAVETFGELSKEMSRLSAKIAEDEDLLQKCVVLKEQYEADIKRIRFSLEGKDKAGEIREPEHCPFCGGTMKAEQEHDCLEASKNDLEALIPKISDLKNEMEFLSAERDQLSKEYDEARKKYDKMNTFLNNTYHPQINSIKAKIREYGESIEKAKEKEIIRKDYVEAVTSLDSVKKELSEAITKFDPSKHLGNLPGAVSAELVNVLATCNFPNAQSAHFDPNKFDIKIGNDTKSDFGKGFIAFLNSVFTYSLHLYLESTAKYNGCPFIIDSPIMSLREIEEAQKIGQDKDLKKALQMKKPLFEYFVEKSRGTQTIIIENEIPKDVAFDDDTVIIRYGRGADPTLPYGFLIGQEK